MSRPLRLEFEGAFWHITSRGNERKDIFREDRDRVLFLSLLATAVKRFRWRLHESCLMTNHYHLVLETPFRTLAKDLEPRVAGTASALAFWQAAIQKCFALNVMFEKRSSLDARLPGVSRHFRGAAGRYFA